MFIRLKPLVCGAAALLSALSVSQAQVSTSAPVSPSSPLETVAAAPAPAPEAPAPVQAPASSAKMSDGSSLMLVQASTAPVPEAATTAAAPEAAPTAPAADAGGVGVREFQGDDVGQVLRLLARQAKVNMVVSDSPVVGTVTMRLEDVTAKQAMRSSCKSEGPVRG